MSEWKVVGDNKKSGKAKWYVYDDKDNYMCRTLSEEDANTIADLGNANKNLVEELQEISTVMGQVMVEIRRSDIPESTFHKLKNAQEDTQKVLSQAKPQATGQ